MTPELAALSDLSCRAGAPMLSVTELARHLKALPAWEYADNRLSKTFRFADGRTIKCLLRGRGLGIACGDRVSVAPTADGEGAIHAILPRGTLLFRSDAHREKLLAANVTQVLGIVAPDPPYDDELVQRWIVAAESNGCAFALIANKSDLPGFAKLGRRLDACRALGYPVVAVSAKGDVSTVRALVADPR